MQPFLNRGGSPSGSAWRRIRRQATRMGPPRRAGQYLRSSSARVRVVQPSHWSAGVPHEVVGDQLSATFERFEQGERPVRPDQREVGVYLDRG
jgi:hypothetical protein